jgi:hypothetical protein
VAKRFKGKNKRSLRWINSDKPKPAVEETTVIYDSAKIWHIAADLESIAKSGIVKGEWTRASCGYYFQMKKRNPQWTTCKACSDAVRGKMASRTSTKTIGYIKRVKVLPERLTEQRFEPPEIL